MQNVHVDKAVTHFASHQNHTLPQSERADTRADWTLLCRVIHSSWGFPFSRLSPSLDYLTEYNAAVNSCI